MLELIPPISLNSGTCLSQLSFTPESFLASSDHSYPLYFHYIKSVWLPLMSEIMEYIFYCEWLILLNRMHSSPIHVQGYFP